MSKNTIIKGKPFKSNGFPRFRSLVGTCDVLNPAETEVISFDEVKSSADKILDAIFCKDSNGFPRSSWAALLGKDTPADIKDYIQNNLMMMKSDGHVVDDDKIVAEYQKLDSEFIAECSRDRFESVQEYEERIKSRIEQLRKEESFRKHYEDFKKKLVSDK